MFKFLKALLKNNSSKNDYCIFIAYHKKDKLLKNDIVIPINAGRELINLQQKEDRDWLINNTIGDNTGDNISNKNKWYSEVTVTYWIYKNIKAKYVGLMHYRRIFNFQEKEIKNNQGNILKQCKITKNNIEKLMKEYDIILPKKLNFKNSVYEQYEEWHYIKDLDFALEFIKEKYPEMNKYAEEIKNEKSGYFCNMLITSKEIFDEYAKWLFNILFEFEKQVDDRDERIEYQQRAEAFLAERLSNIYFKYLINEKSLKVKEVDVIIL